MESAKKSKNSLTLYSTGIGVHEREYELDGKDIPVSIPMKKDALSAALQTICWDGCDVTNGPSFSTTEAPDFFVEGDLLKFFCTKLRGANISIKRSGGKIEGVLVGSDVMDLDRGAYKSQVSHLSVMDDSGCIERVRFEEIVAYQFTDPLIRDTLKKALSASLEATKPNSTSLNFTISGKGTGRIRFGVPLACPKPSVRIRQDGDKFWLDVCAVIFNPTDEKWEDTEITVVTGHPNAIDGDLNVATMPVREKVSIAQKIVGVVQPKKGINAASSRNMAPQAMGMDSGGHEAMASFAPPQAERNYAATHSLVGDFAIFTCKELQTIESQTGSLVVLHSAALPEAEIVTYYAGKTAHGLRTVAAVNTLPYAIGRANYAVYQTDERKRLILKGENVLDTVAKGAFLMVPHAVETGMTRLREQGETSKDFSQVRISEGMVTQGMTWTAKTTHKIDNKTGENRTVIIDHECVIPDSEATSDVERMEQFEGGCRFKAAVRADSGASVVISEKKVIYDRIELGLSWLRKTIIDSGHSLSENPAIRALMETQEAIDRIDREIAQNNESMQAFDQRSATIRSNLSVGGNDRDMDVWRQNLASNDKESQKILTEILPALNRKKSEQIDLRQKQLKALKVEWKK